MKPVAKQIELVQLMQLGAKRGEVVQLMQKFVARSHVGIFRNKEDPILAIGL